MVNGESQRASLFSIVSRFPIILVHLNVEEDRETT